MSLQPSYEVIMRLHQSTNSKFIPLKSGHVRGAVLVNVQEVGKKADLQGLVTRPTIESNIEGSQQSVISLWFHCSRKAQLSHHVTEI